MINKRASGFMDLLFIVIFMAVTAIVLVVAFMTINLFSDGIQDQTAIPQLVKDKASGFSSNFATVWDAGFVFFIFILWAGLIATSFMLDNHPAFFIFFLILGILVVFIAVPLANVLIAFAEDVTIGAYFDQLPMTKFMMTNSVLLVVFFIVSTGIALYAKNQIEGGANF